jgi:hypothetical protein
VGPVLNEFVVAMAFVDVDYSSNVLVLYLERPVR